MNSTVLVKIQLMAAPGVPGQHKVVGAVISLNFSFRTVIFYDITLGGIADYLYGANH